MTGLKTFALFGVDNCRLLAGQSQYAQMGQRFRPGGGGLDWNQLWLLIALVTCVVGIAWLVSRYLQYREQRNADNPHLLFRELCRAHGLDRHNQQLLRALAHAQRLPSPAHLFIRPDCFDVQHLGDGFESRQAYVAALRSQLFTDLDEASNRPNHSNSVSAVDAP